MTNRPRRILPVIVASQFACTSLWFAGNAVLGDLQHQWNLEASALGWVTSAVQLGFICGTLGFAFLAIADRYPPRNVFFLCALLGAAANAALLLAPSGLGMLLASRFAVGVFLAGIYPVGMKIAGGWYRDDLGNALGYLVGALVLGTAFPHLMKGLGAAWPWQSVIAGTSLIAVLGGLLMQTLVPDGPYHPKASPFDPRALGRIFRSARFRASAFGYFGHQWELYAFWAFLPVVFAARPEGLNGSLWSFAVIAAGTLGCIAGGLVSLRLGSARVAGAQLAASGLCCLLWPLALAAPLPVFLAFLLFWGVVVVGDSPQYSAMNAANAPRDAVGSALTIGNCIGFAITIFSIELLSAASQALPLEYLYVLLAPGPALGLLALRPLLRPTGTARRA